MDCLSMEIVKATSEVFESIATIVAISVGGAWTYFLFIKNRLNYPTIEPTVSVKQFSLGQGKKLIHAEVVIENTGSILLRSHFAELRLRQVTPAPDGIIREALEGYDPIPQGAQQIEWPLLAGREWIWSENEFEIEPKEVDSLHADFIVDEDLDVVELYFYLKNHKKMLHKLGWAVTNLFCLNGNGE